MSKSRTPSSRFARIASIAGASAATLALAASGCGKEPNTTPRSFLHFSHTFPEAPRALDLSAGLNVAASASGSAIAVRDADLVALDRDNGTLVRLDLKTLAVLETVAVGNRPEQLVIAPSGDIWVSLRGSGEVVRLNSNLGLVARHKLGADVHGLALAPDGLAVHATLFFEGQVVTLSATGVAGGDFIETSCLDVGDLPSARASSRVSWRTRRSGRVTMMGEMRPGATSLRATWSQRSNRGLELRKVLPCCAVRSQATPWPVAGMSTITRAPGRSAAICRTDSSRQQRGELSHG